MAIEHLQRVVIANDTQAAVEAVTGALAEIVFGRNTATGAIGYSIDAGVTWVWLPVVSGLTSFSLDDLTDVTITTPTSGQVLTYNGAIWTNQGFTTGEILVDDGGAILTADNDDVLYEG